MASHQEGEFSLGRAEGEMAQGVLPDASGGAEVPNA